MGVDPRIDALGWVACAMYVVAGLLVLRRAQRAERSRRALAGFGLVIAGGACAELARAGLVGLPGGVLMCALAAVALAVVRTRLGRRLAGMGQWGMTTTTATLDVESAPAPVAQVHGGRACR